jgi:NTE family protein
VFNNFLNHFYIGLNAGSFYKAGVIKARIDLPLNKQFYLEPSVSYNNRDYLESTELLIDVDPTVLSRVDRTYKLNIGWPIGQRFKSVLFIAGINTLDHYSNNDVYVSSDTLDVLRLQGGIAGFEISSNTLNRKQYPSAGKYFSLEGSYFSVEEEHVPGNTATAQGEYVASLNWFQIRVKAEHYLSKGWYKPAYYVEGVLSNQPVLRNYTGTIINTPAFSPLQDSPTLILENFRAFNYLAGGIKNVFTIRPKLDFRLEAYVFKPFEYLQQGSDQEVVFRSDLSTFYFAGTAGFVLHSPIGPVSLSFNYYDDPQNQFGVLLHAGFLLFNKHPFE